jgi:hypothetical protein
MNMTTRLRTNQTKGYKSDNESVLRRIVLVLVLINQANPSPVVSLPGYKKRILIHWSKKEKSPKPIEENELYQQTIHLINQKVTIFTSPSLKLDLIPLEVSPAFLRLGKGLSSKQQKKTYILAQAHF